MRKKFDGVLVDERNRSATNGFDKLTTAREIPVLYVIFLGNDYGKAREGTVA